MEVITQDQYNVYKEDFGRYDTNGNGRLEPEELLTLTLTLTLIGRLEPEELRRLADDQYGRPCSDDEFKALTKMMDYDQDGKVSLEEYIRSIHGAYRVSSNTDFRRNSTAGV